MDNAENYELKFIGAAYERYILPPDDQYLLKYFRTPLQQDFLKYFFVFGCFQQFSSHTGWATSYRWCQELRAKYKFIDNALAKAKEEGDLDQITLIKTGRLRVKNKYKTRGWNQKDPDNYMS